VGAIRDGRPWCEVAATPAWRPQREGAVWAKVDVACVGVCPGRRQRLGACECSTAGEQWRGVEMSWEWWIRVWEVDIGCHVGPTTFFGLARLGFRVGCALCRGPKFKALGKGFFIFFSICLA